MASWWNWVEETRQQGTRNILQRSIFDAAIKGVYGGVSFKADVQRVAGIGKGYELYVRRYLR